MASFWRVLFLLLAMASGLRAQDCKLAHGRTQNTLIPDVKFTFIPRHVTENSAVAFLAEAGRRNVRFNGTFGLVADCENRFKVSGEYLQQKLGYKYTTGTAHRWVRQFAFGASYEHDFCNPYIASGELSGYCSYAPTRHLSRQSCGTFDVFRRIAGSTAYGGDIGSTIHLWPCAFLYLEANYDSVIYHRRYSSNKHVRGFGGSLGFHQRFFDCLGLGLRAEFRRPFNYYRISLNWAHPQWSGLTVGVFGSHAKGKNRLPSNTMAGVELNYVFSGLFNACDDHRCGSPTYCNPELACWVATPAVYLPEVLAIAEEKVRNTCSSVPSSTKIPNVSFNVAGPYAIDVAPYFTTSDGSSLVFSATGLPPDATIDAITGIITGFAASGLPPAFVTVTASTSCASTSQNFVITFCSNIPTSTPIPPFATCATGPFSYDTGSFFSNPPGSNPLVFSATGLPAFAAIDSATGIISGNNPSNDDVYVVTVTADNGCSSTSQMFPMIFTCPAPTSTTIPTQERGSLVGTPYVVDAVPQHFTSPCGQPFVFSSDSLPPGSSIDPVTGIITGVSTTQLETVTVVGTTDCGVTQQTFQIDFRSSFRGR